VCCGPAGGRRRRLQRLYRQRTSRAVRGRRAHAQLTATACTYVCMFARMRCYGGGGGAAGQPTTMTPPRQSARPFRRLVGVDKVSHGGRHLTTNAKSVPPPAFTVCAMAARHRNIIIADAGRGMGSVLVYLPTYKNVIEGKKFKNCFNII